MTFMAGMLTQIWPQFGQKLYLSMQNPLVIEEIANYRQCDAKPWFYILKTFKSKLIYYPEYYHR